MGKALADRFPVARHTFEEADEAFAAANVEAGLQTRLQTRRLSTICWEGPETDLQLTEITQPALVTVSTAAFSVLSRRGLTPDFVAGHSLGEYSALVAAGSLRFTDAVRLVRNRGRYMQAAVPEGVGAMAAIIKLPPDCLDRILGEAAQGEVVTAANLNSPEQIVIAGNAAAVERAMELAKAAGAKRVVALSVSAPFHCPLMKPAQARLKPELDATPFADLQVPLINNWQAREIYTGADACEGLYQQVPNPVRWSDSILRLSSDNVTRFIEVGPGTVLTGLLRNIDSSLTGLKFGEASDIEKLAAFAAS